MRRGARNNSGGWLSPEAYKALSRQEKMELAARRQQQRFQYPRRGRRKPRRGFGGYLRYQGKIMLGVIACVFIVGWLSESGLSLPNLRQKTAAISESFGYCYTGGGTNCVVDGDTFWFQGMDIRIADIDAPETHEWHCPSEKALGDQATERLHSLLNSGPISLQPIDRDQDVYGRKLRLVYVNGTSVGETLISEGLAHRYVRGKLPWC